MQQVSSGVVAICILASGFVQASAAPPDARTAWIGVKVLPKENCKVKVGNKEVDRKDLGIPYIVQDVNGEWLWVGEHTKGWVQRSQVVTLDEAPQYYTGLIRANPRNAWAYNLRGTAWKEKGELGLAIADFNELLRLDPDAIAYNNRGYAWNGKKEFDKAIADFNQALRLDPNFAKAYSGKAYVYLFQGQVDAAIKNFERALELDRSIVQHMKQDSDFDAIRSDPRYQALVRKYDK